MIPERSNQEANRKRRGSKGGSPVGLDKEAYKRRNVVERSFNVFKQWRGLAARYDQVALTYRAAESSSAPSSSGSRNWETCPATRRRGQFDNPGCPRAARFRGRVVPSQVAASGHLGWH